MNLHIITPCSRIGWILPAFISIEQAVFRAGIENFKWTLVVTPEERKQFPELWLIDFVELFVSDIGGNNCLAGVKKVNDYISKADIDPDTFLWLFSDDNLLPINIIKRIKESLERNPQSEVVVTSHKRGQRFDNHPCQDLIASPDNMKPSSVSGEQYFFKRRHFTPWQTENNQGDGQFIQALYKKIPDKFLFLPDTWTSFDGQKIARWDKDKIDELVFKKGGIDL